MLERPVAPPELATSDLIIAAARPLPTSPDRVIVATVTPDHPSPATAPLVQHGLGLPHVPAFDVAAACAGFVYALDLAARAITCGDREVLVAAGECRFRTLEAAAPGVRVLFGDGAAAARITAAPTSLRLLATGLGADGSGHADEGRVAPKELPQRVALGFLPPEDHKPPLENLPDAPKPARLIRASDP